MSRPADTVMKTASATGAASAVTSARVVVVAVVALVLVWVQHPRPTTSAEVASFAAVPLGAVCGEAVRTDPDCPAAVEWCMCSCADASAADMPSGATAARPWVIVPGTHVIAHASSNDGVPAKHTISTRLITRRGRKVTIRVYPPRPRSLATVTLDHALGAAVCRRSRHALWAEAQGG